MPNNNELFAKKNKNFPASESKIAAAIRPGMFFWDFIRTQSCLALADLPNYKQYACLTRRADISQAPLSATLWVFLFSTQEKKSLR